jgi:hypothetical protein
VVTGSAIFIILRGGFIMLTKEELTGKLLDLRRLHMHDSEGQAFRDHVASVVEPLPFYQKAVLIDYYLHGFNWDKVSMRMGYSQSQCKRIRNKGIESLLSVFNDAHDTISQKTTAGNIEIQDEHSAYT